MKVGSVFVSPSSSFSTAFQLGVKLYKGGQVVWELPLMAWDLGWAVGFWVNLGSAQGADADKVGFRVADLPVPLKVRLESTAGEGDYLNQLPPTAALQEYTFDLPASATTAPPPAGGGGSTAPGSPVSIVGLSLDRTQVKAGEKVKVSANVQVNATFRGHMVTFFTVGASPRGPLSTGLQDWLSGSYSVSLVIDVPADTPPGTYPVTWRVLDAQNNTLAEFTTDPILTVTEAPPPVPLPTGVAISSLAVNPTQIKPGEKVMATAQVTVSATFKGFMSFALFGITVSTPEKDWLAGSYPVSLEVTTPQNTRLGIYQGVWMVIDTQANKMLASREAPVEVVGVTKPPATPTTDWLTPMVGVASLALVGQMVTRLPKLLERARK